MKSTPGQSRPWFFSWTGFQSAISAAFRRSTASIALLPENVIFGSRLSPSSKKCIGMIISIYLMIILIFQSCTSNIVSVENAAITTAFCRILAIVVCRSSLEPGARRRNDYYGSEKKVDSTNNILYDCFYRAQDPVYNDGRTMWSRQVAVREKIWLSREFPIQCNACGGVTLNDANEMMQHCARYEHISRAKPEEKRIPNEFVDPRHDPEYATMNNAFHKAKVMSEYRARVVRFLRAPMDEVSKANMNEFVRSAKANVVHTYSEYGAEYGGFYTYSEFDNALANCTLDRVIKVCVEDFAVRDFLEYGLVGYCLDVVLYGWANFAMHGSGSNNIFLTHVTGWEYA